MVVGISESGRPEAQAEADFNSIGTYLEQAYPKDDGDRSSHWRGRACSATMGRPIAAFVTAIMALAGLVPLAACANLGSLLAARAADRARELALRLALGASRARILRQMFTEAALIS
jgi:ABC-type antimicrobial peptide transport system permease subunit